MRKMQKTKLILCICFLFLLTINVLGTSVSDNDGSAFITKAEFDSLKNNFQAQIDQYNQSLDSKIDSAIASYLAGIKLDTVKKFKVYGPEFGVAPHIWQGKQSRFIRLRNITSSAFSSSPDSHILVENLTRNDPYGLGSCWWVIGYHPSGSAKTIADEADAFISYAANIDWTTRVYNQTESSSSAVSATNFQYVANKSLSIAFQSIVTPQKPELKLIEFLDSGHVSVGFYYGSDGANIEAGTKGGSSGDGGYLENNTYLSLHHGSSYTDYTYVKDDWVTLDFDVTAGDYLCLRNCGGINTVGRYSLFFWESDIPGWELETT